LVRLPFRAIQDNGAYLGFLYARPLVLSCASLLLRPDRVSHPRQAVH